MPVEARFYIITPYLEVRGIRLGSGFHDSPLNAHQQLNIFQLRRHVFPDRQTCVEGYNSNDDDATQDSTSIQRRERPKKDHCCMSIAFRVAPKCSGFDKYGEREREDDISLDYRQKPENFGAICEAMT